MFVSRSPHSRRILKGLATSALLVSTAMAGLAFAQCGITGTDKWASYTPSANEAADAVQGIRYQASCGLVVGAASSSYATDDNPVQEAAMYGYFWIYTRGVTIPTGSTVTVYRLLDNGGNPQMTVQLQGTAGGLQLALAAGGQSGSIPISNVIPFQGWHEVQFSYTQGNGDGTASMRLDRNTAAAGTVSLSNLTNAPIEDAELGAITSTGSPTGNLRFDSYLSQRNALVEADLLTICDPSGNGTPAEISDVLLSIEEYLEGSLSPGTPDCTGNGEVGIGDVLLVIEAYTSS